MLIQLLKWRPKSQASPGITSLVATNRRASLQNQMCAALEKKRPLSEAVDPQQIQKKLLASTDFAKVGRPLQVSQFGHWPPLLQEICGSHVREVKGLSQKRIVEWKRTPKTPWRQSQISHKAVAMLWFRKSARGISIVLSLVPSKANPRVFTTLNAHRRSWHHHTMVGCVEHCRIWLCPKAKRWIIVLQDPKYQRKLASVIDHNYIIYIIYIYSNIYVYSYVERPNKNSHDSETCVGSQRNGIKIDSLITFPTATKSFQKM